MRRSPVACNSLTCRQQPPGQPRGCHLSTPRPCPARHTPRPRRTPPPAGQRLQSGSAVLIPNPVRRIFPAITPPPPDNVQQYPYRYNRQPQAHQRQRRPPEPRKPAYHFHIQTLPSVGKQILAPCRPARLRVPIPLPICHTLPMMPPPPHLAPPQIFSRCHTAEIDGNCPNPTQPYPHQQHCNLANLIPHRSPPAGSHTPSANTAPPCPRAARVAARLTANGQPAPHVAATASEAGRPGSHNRTRTYCTPYPAS